MNHPIKYLKFQWQAKNLHAIHSPFLFSLIQKAVYQNFLPKDFKHSLDQNESLYLSIINYFHYQKIYLNHPSISFGNIINTFEDLKSQQPSYHHDSIENKGQYWDLYILNDLKSKEDGLHFINKIKDTKQKCVIIPQLRASNVQLDFFRSFPKNEKGSVILEFYGFAIIIYRTESSGEYFKIRKWGTFR